MAADASCVFHGDDRYVFNALVLSLRKLGLVTREHAQVMAMTVCTCRKKVAHRQPISEKQVRDAADHVMEESDGQLAKLSKPARDVAMSSAHVALRLPMTSQGRLSVVISQALRGDVTLLKEEAADALASRGEDYLKAKQGDKRKKIPTRDVVRSKIINKKKRKNLIKTTFTLPLFGGATLLLFRNPRVGPNFSRMCVKRACVLEIDHGATALNMEANKATTVMKAWCSSREVLDDVINVLTGIAVQIQGNNTMSWQKRRSQWQSRRINVPNSSRIAAEKSQVFSDYKETLTLDFEKKRSRKPSRPKRRPDQREDSSTYVEGHCLFCFLPLKQFQDGRNDLKACRHHPGYVTNRKWTCCNGDSDPQLSTREEHAQSGKQQPLLETAQEGSPGGRGEGTSLPTGLSRTSTAVNSASHVQIPRLLTRRDRGCSVC